MTKQEQIEEMINTLAASNNPFVDVPVEIMPQVAKALYNAGYRKSEEVRKETAKEICSKMYDFAYRTKSYYTDALNDIIAKIDETFNDFRIELESLLREYYVEVEE